ncbi:hypothetical protein FMM74_019135 [Lachnospiraceae bacterium MD308]|nr:hypothetical protein [Lachnospiraceae bacterium MD308]
MFEKNVCKGCGKGGYFLKLNKDLLCEECVDLQNKEMTLSEFDEELTKWYKGEGTLKKVNSYMKAQDAKSQREEKSFNKVFNRYQKARELEKSGKLDNALEIYLKILKNCPPGTDYYVRPCIILEKKHQYTQAVELCDLAIKNIRIGRFNADENEFLHRKNRLLRKIEKEKK